MAENYLIRQQRNDRGQTRTGHRGWIAWFDDDASRRVCLSQAVCIQWITDTLVRIDPEDGDSVLDVPHGRLQPTPVLALEELAVDVWNEYDRGAQKTSRSKMAADAGVFADEMEEAGRPDVAAFLRKVAALMSGRRMSQQLERFDEEARELLGDLLAIEVVKLSRTRP